MKTEQGGITLCPYLILGILLILCPIIDSCSNGASHPSKVGRYDPSFVSEICNGVGSSFKKSVMESYYEKHESFQDPIFDKFLTNDLPIGLCESQTLPCNLSLSVLWNIKGEGSHRQLSTTTRFNINDSIDLLPTHHCKIIVIARLPSGVFADPFELEHLLHRAVFSHVAVYGDTNLELPSILSNLSIVEVHKDIGLNTASRDKSLFDFTIDLPLHSRYPPLDESGYVGVRLKTPDLFLQCRLHELEISHDSNCLIMLKNGDSKRDLTWSIPAGKRSYAKTVTFVTFASAFLSVLAIIQASIYSIPN